MKKERRMVKVDDKITAEFIKYGVVSDVVLNYANENVGVQTNTRAVVEYPDGSVKLVELNRIKFLPPKNPYTFEELSKVVGFDVADRMITEMHNKKHKDTK